MTTQDDLLNILKQFAERAAKVEHYATREEAHKELQDFLAGLKQNPLKVGDIVERNEQGLDRYAMPRQNQVAIVVELLKEPKFGDDWEDMVIAVALAKGVVRFFSVNSAYYQKGSAKATAAYSFKKEKTDEKTDGGKSSSRTYDA